MLDDVPGQAQSRYHCNGATNKTKGLSTHKPNHMHGTTNRDSGGIPFVKMHGLLNDYVYLDGFHNRLPTDLPELARAMSDRHAGIGADGLIVILPSSRADARMRMYNADGSEAEMCGNGIRCVAKYLSDRGMVSGPRMTIETGAGILTLEVFEEGGKVSAVRVDMGRPELDARRVPALFSESPAVNQLIEIEGRIFTVTAIGMGNPHCVVFDEVVDDRLVLEWGPRIETSRYFPNRVNVEFVHVLSRREVVQRTWERGAGETLACGTGASAVCVAGVLTGRLDREITNHLRGGALHLTWDETTGHVFKTGPAVEVFSGLWPLPNGNQGLHVADTDVESNSIF